MATITKVFFQCVVCSILLVSSAHAQVVNWVDAVGRDYYYGWDAGSAKAVDPSGNIVATYVLIDSARIGDSLFQSAGVKKFIAAVNPAGHLIWATQLNANAISDYYNQSALAVDSSGNIYLATYFGDSVATYGNFALHGKQNWRSLAFVRFSSQGVVQSAVSLGVFDSNRFNFGYGSYYNNTYHSPKLEVSPSGFLYLSFGKRDSLSLGASHFAAQGKMIFTISRLSFSGQIQWSKKLNAIDTTTLTNYYGGNAICAMPDGSCAVEIPFSDTLTVDTFGVRAKSYYPIAIARINSSGNALWMHDWDGSDINSDFYRLSGDRLGNLYRLLLWDSTSIFHGIPIRETARFILLKINPQGNIIWVRGIPVSPSSNYLNYGAGEHAIAVDYGGNLFFCAAASPYSYWAPYSFNTSTSASIVVKLGPNGDLSWISTVSDSLAWTNISILPAGRSGYYLNGSYNRTSIVGPTLLPVSGGTNYYYRLLAHMTTANFRTNAPYQLAYCPSDTIQVPYHIAPQLYSKNAFIAELSDSSGSFSNPIAIGSLKAKSDSIIVATIPANVTGGVNYRVRVRSTAPILLSDTRRDPFTIYPPASIKILARKGAEACIGDRVALSATGGGFYKWSTGDTSDVIYTSNAGVYKLAGIDSNGCSNTDSISVMFDSLPHITLTPFGPLHICEGDSVRLVAHGGQHYVWTTLDTVASIYVSKPGQYYALGYNKSSCQQSSDTLQITVLPSPPTPIITRSGLTLSSSSDSNNQWYYHNVKLSAEAGKELHATAFGPYTVTVTLPDGCSRTSQSFNLTQESGVNAPDNSDLNLSVVYGSTTIIRFSLATPANVSIDVFDLLGRQVSTVYRGNLEMGELTFPIANIGAGKYFVRLSAGLSVKSVALVLQQ